MTQKFPKGTEVRIKKEYPYRPELRCMVFISDDTDEARGLDPRDGSIIKTDRMYKSPFMLPDGSDNAWVPEEWLEPYLPDEDFDYLDDYSVWTPQLNKVPDYGHAHA